MLTKLWCWLFGHYRTERVWTGKIVRMYDFEHGRFGADLWDEKVFETVELKTCPRCGVKLEETKP
jgi:hypothetical protein